MHIITLKEYYEQLMNNTIDLDIFIAVLTLLYKTGTV